MIGIVIVAHANLAQEYLVAVEHVFGPQTGIEPVAIESDYNRQTKQSEICKAAKSVDDGDGVIFVTDMFGGSPSNLSLNACDDPQKRVIYGMNLPLLLKLVKSRDQKLDVALTKALVAGRKHMNVVGGPPE